MKPTGKQQKENMQRAHNKGMKQINMIDMANIETRMRANK